MSLSLSNPRWRPEPCPPLLKWADLFPSPEPGPQTWWCRDPENLQLFEECRILRPREKLNKDGWDEDETEEYVIWDSMNQWYLHFRHTVLVAWSSYPPRPVTHQTPQRIASGTRWNQYWLVWKIDHSNNT